MPRLPIPLIPRPQARALLATLGCALLAPAAAASSLWIADDHARLGRIDLSSGIVSLIGEMGAQMTDIAFDAQGRLFGVTFQSALFSIDPSNGATSLVGRLGVTGVNSLVFGADGTLYGASDRLYTIDPTSGRARTVGNGGTPYQSSGDLAFVDGRLFLSGSGSRGDTLLQLDTDSGAAQVVGPIGVSAVFGMATDSQTSLYGVANTGVYGLDPATAQATKLFDYRGQGLGNAYGTSFVTEAQSVVSVPELPPLPMLLAGLGCVWWLARRTRT